MPCFVLAPALLLPLLGPTSAVEPLTDHADLASGKLRVSWRLGKGWLISYDGVPAFVPLDQELVLHPEDWSTAYYRSSEHRPKAALSRAKDTQSLRLAYTGGGLDWTQTVTVGPGDRLRIAYTYTQNGWQEASVQLGLPRPAAEFWVGSRFQVKAEKPPDQGAIPLAYDKQVGRHPFEDASELQLSSLAGHLRLKASKPISFWDYPKRQRGFFLGLDEPMSRGDRMQFAVEMAFGPPRIEQGGLVVHGLRLPPRVEDGVLRLSVRLARAEAGPKRVTVDLTASASNGRKLRAAQSTVLTTQPRTIEQALPLPVGGRYEVGVVIRGPDRKPLLDLPARPVQAASLLTVRPGRMPYTDERQGVLLVRAANALTGAPLTFRARTPVRPLAVDHPVKPGQSTRVSFSLGLLRPGRNRVMCSLRQGAREAAAVTIEIWKLAPKPNTVKIDYDARGLVVDGLPFYPFGFYCTFPIGDLPDQEITNGFVHIAPYQSQAKAQTPERLKQIRAYMDRCAAIGMKVHYDVRSIAQLAPSPQKWQWLRAEVEAFRDHPALLCWYLCDEPAGRGVKPEWLDQAYEFVKNLDPHHPITQVFCVPTRARDYVNGLDIVMADPYPIPNRPVTLVSDWTDMLNRMVEHGKPVWIVPQAFGGGEHWKREPSHREARVMTYLALIHDAKGIQYFVRRPPLGNPVSPSLWSECRRLSLEAAELAPALLSAEARPVVSVRPTTVHAAAWRDRGRILILAANTVNEPVRVALSLADIPYTGKAEVLFENREADVAKGALTEMVEAFGTRVYSLPVGPAPRQDLSVHPHNLTTNPSFEQMTNVGSPDSCYVWAGPDRGATVFVDSRVARHGRHSLRITTPTESRGSIVCPFPVPLRKGRAYRLSVWARARAAGAPLVMAVGGLEPKAVTVKLSTEWREYELVGKAPKSNARAGITLNLLGPGTAWLDLIQFVREK